MWFWPALHINKPARTPPPRRVSHLIKMFFPPQKGCAPTAHNLPLDPPVHAHAKAHARTHTPSCAHAHAQEHIPTHASHLQMT